ncbi:MAG: phosphodiester glycosidase family protein [Pseudomonadota bacterium]
MKRLVLCLLAATASSWGSAKDTAPVPEALTCPIDERSERIDDLVSVSHICYGIRGHAVVHVAEIDLGDSRIRFRTTAGGGGDTHEFTASLTSAFAESVGATVAVNAGYFEPFESGTHGTAPYPAPGDPVNVLGQHIADGVQVSDNRIDIPRFRLRVDGAFCANWNSARIVDGPCPDATDQAIGAGPLLLRAGRAPTFGKFDPRFALKRAPRTALALNADRSVLWLIVVDGRQPGYSEGMNLPELADFLRSLGAVDALNLDGGGSAVLVGPEGRLLSRPIQERVPGKERVVANHLGVLTGS